jgi:hypothetical protein
MKRHGKIYRGVAALIIVAMLTLTTSTIVAVADDEPVATNVEDEADDRKSSEKNSPAGADVDLVALAIILACAGGLTTFMLLRRRPM